MKPFASNYFDCIQDLWPEVWSKQTIHALVEF